MGLSLWTFPWSVLFIPPLIFRVGVSSAREKRQQPASRVSFTPQTQEKLCPLLDSPPSPFVSSPNPISNGDQTEKGVSPPKQKAFIRSPLQVKVTSKNVKQSPKHLQATQKRKHKKAEAKEYPRTLLSNKTVAKQNSSQNREKNNPNRRQVYQRTVEPC